MTHTADVAKLQKGARFQPSDRIEVAAYLWDKDEAVDCGRTHKDASRSKTKQQIVPSTEETVN